MLLLVLQPEGIRKGCAWPQLVSHPFWPGGFYQGRGSTSPPSSLEGRETRKSLWISFGALFILKTNKLKAQPLSKHRRKQSIGIAGHICIGGRQPRGSWVVAGRGKKISLFSQEALPHRRQKFGLNFLGLLRMESGLGSPSGGCGLCP